MPFPSAARTIMVSSVIAELHCGMRSTHVDFLSLTYTILYCTASYNNLLVICARQVHQTMAKDKSGCTLKFHCRLLLFYSTLVADCIDLLWQPSSIRAAMALKLQAIADKCALKWILLFHILSARRSDLCCEQRGKF